MIAKSNGLKLNVHSNIVKETSLILLKKLGSDYDRFSDIIKYSALLHDIGKLTIKFQKFLVSEKLKSPGLKFRHNEIGWAFLSKYLSYNFNERDIILNIVYWHHGISNKIATHTDSEILDSLDSKDIDNMLEYLIECVGEKNINKDDYIESIHSPLFYPTNSTHNFNSKLILCRSVVTTSDRISSNLTEINQVNEELIDNYLDNNYDQNINCVFEGTERFELQKNIVDKTTKTTLIKAPAGFGKTMMGLLWSMKNNKKLLWVVPRNSIADSIYYSILEELNNLNITPSVQLVLSGEVKKSNTDINVMYDSDIIVTNIDNFLAPSFKNDVMDISSLLLGSNVVFDEYHELVTKAPLMSMFIDIMKTRNTLTNSDTLLLSATPIDCHYLWESISNKTTILPDDNTHYPAIHNKKYLINILSEVPNVLDNSTTLVIKNTISNAQKEKTNNNYDLLLHSNFLDDKKDEDLLNLLKGYGKKSKSNNKKPNIIGTPIIQAALDISFNTLCEDILSPEYTLQRIGRCDRFGDQPNQSVINIVRNSEDSKIKDILYTNQLSDEWFETLKKYNGTLLTLDEIYIIFNNFKNNKDNKDKIKKFINKNNDESKRYLSKIYPVKFDNKNSSDVLKAGSNKLRCVNNEIFYIVKHKNGNDWVGPFTKQILKPFDEEFKENKNMRRNMEKVMKSISKDERFEYDNLLKLKDRLTIDIIRRYAKKSNTPYIVFDRVYCDDLGIIKNN